jgi:L-lactate dehydrogenase complex protein LldG
MAQTEANMSARDTVLGSIRRSLGVNGGEAARAQTVAARIGAHPRGVIPARGQGTADEKLALFLKMVEISKASAEVLSGPEQVPAAVARYLRSRNLPHAVRKGADPRLAAMPWSSEPALEVNEGASAGDDLVSVSHAFAAVAESGTAVLLSGAGNPTTLNFLPDHHLVVVDAREIEGDYETVWDQLRARFGDHAMPRVVNWITGPSRSGDIEQTHLLGAHGPRSVHVLVLRNS